jgi:CheY-like chemotaxis protein
MSTETLLQDKIILVVDDEPDILETVGEILDMCLVYKASSYDEAVQYLKGYTIDIAVLDIMGVNGFELLKRSVAKGVPTVMLTAHALTPEALKKSMKLGNSLSGSERTLKNVSVRIGKRRTSFLRISRRLQGAVRKVKHDKISLLETHLLTHQRD